MSVKPAQLDLLQQLMSTAELRHEVISQNIANVNTPGYHRRDVSFEDALRQTLASGDESAVRGLQANVYVEQGLPSRADGNNVDVDREIGQLNKNALLYQTYAQVLATRMGMMRSAVSGQ